MKELFDLKGLLAIKGFKGNNVILAFTVLRFIACCLITNTHYNDVYPIKALAVGGLLGDVLFFVVSGFVLARPIKDKFLPWYWKRIVRIYPAIILGVAIYIFTDCHTACGMDEMNWFEAFVFPTYFVFTAAIMILYIPFYFVNKIETKRNFKFVIFIYITLWLLVYLFIFDKSSYEMNSTWNPMIAFPYFTCMLIGAYIRKFGLTTKGLLRQIVYWVLCFVFLGLYFVATKMVRADYTLNPIQIVVPITLLIGTGYMTVAFYCLENTFKKLPEKVMTVVNFIAMLTLEIYVIQKPIIYALDDIIFPLNWILITAGIIAGAVVLRIVVNFIVNGTEMLFKRLLTNK